MARVFAAVAFGTCRGHHVAIAARDAGLPEGKRLTDGFRPGMAVEATITGFDRQRNRYKAALCKPSPKRAPSRKPRPSPEGFKELFDFTMAAANEADGGLS